MNAVITVIRASGPLDASVLAAEFRRRGLSFDRPKWLSRDRAMDLYGPCDSIGALRERIEASCGGFFADRQTDWIVQPAENRRKKMLITDMDSTVIQCECIDELADMAGIKDRVARITEAAMNGTIDFPDALRQRVAMLKGLPADKLQAVLDERVRLTPGAKELVSTMRGYGAMCVLVSGGFTFFTKSVGRQCGFDFHHACRLEIRDSVLTGAVTGEIVDREAKLRYFELYRDRARLSDADVLAIGDGANDIPMMQAAGIGVAFHAKEKVNSAITNRIRFNDLRAALYIQGYADQDIK